MYMYLSVLVSACEVFEDLKLFVQLDLKWAKRLCLYLPHTCTVHILSDVT